MSDREEREARALAIVKAIRPGSANLMVPVPPPPQLVRAIPPKPDPTFTLLGFPDGAEYAANIVYFMYSAGRIKIGYSGSIRSRHRGLRNAGPFQPIVLLVIKGTEALEKKLHRQFAKDRLHGEWFAISNDMLTYLRQRLCETGRGSFERAQAEYHDHCMSFVAAHKPLGKPLVLPRKDRPKPVCAHGVIAWLRCAPCERERDLAIVESVNNGTYTQ